jgi:hypothetical protein
MNATVGRVNDGGEFVDIHHAEIGNSECIMGKFIRL